jgi:hypothetical protein
MLSAVSLFSGAGGFCEGVRLAGFKVVCAVESDKTACQTHRINFSDVALFEGDITRFLRDEQPGVPGLAELTKKRIDLVYGGPPCQGFSQIGPRKTDDPRNRLYKEFVRVVRLGRRVHVPEKKETESRRPSDPPRSAEGEETAQSRHGESDSLVQEEAAAAEREASGAAEGVPPMVSAPESHPEAADSAGEGDITAAVESAEEVGAAPPVSPGTAGPMGEDISDDLAGAECGMATADQRAEEIELEAPRHEADAEPDAPIDGGPADHEADAADLAAADNWVGSAAEKNEAETMGAEPAETCPEVGDESAPGCKGPNSRRLAVHRDRRGMRRSLPPVPAAGQNTSPRIDVSPAAASLRLALHAIRRTVSLSLVLSRPEGFPERTTLLLDRQIEVGAYDESRYDDIDVAWTNDLLAGELRISGADGLRWVRSARRVHIFAADPSEPDLFSVSAVRAGAYHALICRIEDVPEVRAIAQLAGSPELVPHDHWQGIPAGWSVLSGFKPAHTTGPIGEAAFRPLDPGADVDIALGGGLAIRPQVFAEGHPPDIEIRPVPEGATVMIGGQQAVQNPRGAWEAPGWDAPGQHIVDVVPGPSLSYEIAADPGNGEGWTFWNAHEEMSGARTARRHAGICGAMLQGPSGEFVVAHEMQAKMIALGASRGAAALERRPEANVSVGFLAEPPTFLFASSGPRRKQGQVIWLGLAGASSASTDIDRVDMAWADAVYTAAVRRLPLVGAERAGEAAWQTAVLRARKLRRQRR